MAKGYLPDTYLRKRQRDARLRQARDVALIVLIVVAAVISGYFIYNRLILPKRLDNGVTEQMAEQRQQLADRQSEQDTAPASNGNLASESSSGGGAANIQEMADADLSSLSYTSSFPLISVSVESGSSGDQREVSQPAESAENAEPTEASETEDTQTQPATTNTGAVESGNERPTPPAQEEKPEEKPEETKPAETKPATGSSGSVVYKVYAGSHFSREDAESQVKDLSAIGLSGTIIEAQPNFLVYVGSFSGFEEAAALRDRLKSSGFSAFASKTKK